MIFSILFRDDFIITNGCHTENVILIVLEGSFDFSLGGTSYHAEKNSVIYFEKNAVFHRRVISPLKLIYVQFVSMPEQQSGPLEFKDACRKNGTIQLLYKAINDNNEFMCRHFLNDLYMQFCAEQQLSEKGYSRDVLEFMDYVKKNYSKKISINKFSDGIFMSHTGFLLKFKRETGVTPVEYINSYRLKTASQLLFDSKLSISRIAELCGYENLYYFSNAFKKKYSLSPTQYRKNNV